AFRSSVVEITSPALRGIAVLHYGQATISLSPDIDEAFLLKLLRVRLPLLGKGVSDEGLEALAPWGAEARMACRGGIRRLRRLQLSYRIRRGY
ncbi:MAG: hypothetical protein RR843_07195, partial [Clostridia bacterium]